jgi:predicted metal-dependent phosphoesterase TrpH
MPEPGRSEETSIPSSGNFPDGSDILPGTVLIDCHTHTAEHSPDSCISAADLIHQAKKAGLDGVIFTDHNYCWFPEELAELRPVAGNDFHVFTGAEIMFGSVHLLVYGIPPGPVPSFDTPCDLSDFAGQHGGCTVIAHPFSAAKRLSSQTILSCGASGLEAYNARRKSYQLRNVFTARELGLAELGGSDCHGGAQDPMGSAATLCPQPVHTMDMFIELILSRTTRAIRK